MKVKVTPKTDRAKSVVGRLGDTFKVIYSVKGVYLLKSISPYPEWTGWMNKGEATIEEIEDAE